MPDWEAVRQIGLGCLTGCFIDVNTYAVNYFVFSVCFICV